MGVIVKNRPYYQSSNRIIPPYPALNVEISDSVDSKRISVLAVIDPGADITCVSEEKIKELESALESYPLMLQSVPLVNSKGEIVEELQTYSICVILEGNFPYIPDNGVLSRDNQFFGEEDMLIGRDILNSLKLILDGPNQTFTIENPKAENRNHY